MVYTLFKSAATTTLKLLMRKVVVKMILFIFGLFVSNLPILLQFKIQVDKTAHGWHSWLSIGQPCRESRDRTQAGPTLTGLKITEEKVPFLILHLQMVRLSSPVMESRCKYLGFWNLLECQVTQCLWWNFLLSRYGTV